ncbi:protein of unknown function [Candidatus Methylomirabilis oxygeniifera]|uniref:Uncharacterized protein n=1 Tax=Methylomirabilis oxygeniifera TaxID=671143 RepID=D5ML42_METO1|nr:protein of unknown function [Candidatus Methylomirabilis oxyfera]
MPLAVYHRSTFERPLTITASRSARSELGLWGTLYSAMLMYASISCCQLPALRDTGWTLRLQREI